MYIPKKYILGLSKMNRITEFFSKRPQVQERLSIQIMNELKKVLNSDDVAVYIDAKHMCVSSRGIKDVSSSTITSSYSGKFKEHNYKNEFLKAIHNETSY